MKFNISIPSTLNEIKLKDYQKYMKIAEENKDAVNFLDLKAIEIFCGIKINDARSIKASDFDDILHTIKETLSEKNKFTQRFKMNGVEYGFIPSLDDISMGEYVDLETYLSDFDNAHKAMAVMYRPITFSKGDMYLIEEYEGSDKYSDVMREAPLGIALGANVFFYNLEKELLKNTIDYSVEEGQMNTQVKQILEENGGGIKAFTQSLEDNLMSLTMSLN